MYGTNNADLERKKQSRAGLNPENVTLYPTLIHLWKSREVGYRDREGEKHALYKLD